MKSNQDDLSRLTNVYLAWEASAMALLQALQTRPNKLEHIELLKSSILAGHFCYKKCKSLKVSEDMKIATFEFHYRKLTMLYKLVYSSSD